MRTLSFPEADTPAELRAQVVEMEDRAWPSRDDPVGRSPDVLSHDPALRPLAMLRADDGGAVLAALSVLFKEIGHAGRSYRAAGLSTVVTRDDVRGAGHGVALVSAAREEAENRYSEEVTLLLRALKITEEAGEVAEAIHGLMGANPRKGRSHTQEDVERELCDVVLTAMVTLATLTPDARSVFRHHLDRVAARSLGESASGLPPQADPLPENRAAVGGVAQDTVWHDR